MNLNTELQVTTTDFSLATLDDKPNYLSDFRQFAELCDNIRLAPRKAAKSLLIADYLTGLHTDELVVATRILSGYVFPLRDHKKLNISGLVILNCLAACAGVPSSFVKERLCELGSLGDYRHLEYTSVGFHRGSDEPIVGNSRHSKKVGNHHAPVTARHSPRS
jgi:hypothetical protein